MFCFSTNKSGECYLHSKRHFLKNYFLAQETKWCKKKFLKNDVHCRHFRDILFNVWFTHTDFLVCHYFVKVFVTILELGSFDIINAILPYKFTTWWYSKNQNLSCSFNDDWLIRLHLEYYTPPLYSWANHNITQ